MRGEPPGGAWVVLGAGDELQRVPRASQGVQRRVRAAAVPAVDRRRRGAGPRHRLRRQVLRPRRPHVLPHRRPRAAAPRYIPQPTGGGARWLLRHAARLSVRSSVLPHARTHARTCGFLT
jgi:hypothetical protein